VISKKTKFMKIQMEIPRKPLSKIRSGVRPGRVETDSKTKQNLSRRPKHLKKWSEQEDL